MSYNDRTCEYNMLVMIPPIFAVVVHHIEVVEM